jgi:hypothetical protein
MSEQEDNEIAAFLGAEPSEDQEIKDFLQGPSRIRPAIDAGIDATKKMIGEMAPAVLNPYEPVGQVLRKIPIPYGKQTREYLENKVGDAAEEGGRLNPDMNPAARMASAAALTPYAVAASQYPTNAEEAGMLVAPFAESILGKMRAAKLGISSAESGTLEGSAPRGQQLSQEASSLPPRTPQTSGPSEVQGASTPSVTGISESVKGVPDDYNAFLERESNYFKVDPKDPGLRDKIIKESKQQLSDHEAMAKEGLKENPIIKASIERAKARLAKAEAGPPMAQAPNTSAPGPLVQFVGSQSKIPRRTFEFARENLDEVANAKPVAEAEQAYGKAAGGLKNSREAIYNRTGKLLEPNSKYMDSINRVDDISNGRIKDAAGNPVPMTPQDALEGVQSINNFFKTKEGTMALAADQDIGNALHNLQENLYSFLENNGNPGMRKAARDLRLAYTKDAFSEWLPKNKNGGTDALRTLLAGAQVAGGVGKMLVGSPSGIPLVASGLSVSPKVAMGVLRTEKAMGNVGQSISNAAQAMNSPIRGTGPMPDTSNAMRIAMALAAKKKSEEQNRAKMEALRKARGF